MNYEDLNKRKDLLKYIGDLSEKSRELIDGTLLNHANLSIEQLEAIPEEKRPAAQVLIEEGLMILKEMETGKRMLTPEENKKIIEIGKEIDGLF